MTALYDAQCLPAPKGVRFGYVEGGPIDDLGNGRNDIPQLNRIELNRSTRAARFLEPTLTLRIRRISVLQRQTVSERKLATKRDRAALLSGIVFACC